MSIETTLALDQTITRFRFQYEKFYRQLRGSMDRERKVLAQLADVKAQMVDNAQRLELALKARKHDESVIRTLRSELEIALQQANSSQSREAHAMSLVKQLRQEVKALTKYAHQTFTESRQHHNGQQQQRTTTLFRPGSNTSPPSDLQLALRASPVSAGPTSYNPDTAGSTSHNPDTAGSTSHISPSTLAIGPNAEHASAGAWAGG